MSTEDEVSLSEPEITTKVHNLARSFVSHCRAQNERVSQRTSQIAVRILLMNPKWNDQLKGEVPKKERQKFIKACFDFLFDEKCLPGITIRMQCFFHGRFLNREAYKEQQKQVLLRNCFHLLQKLKKVWHNATEDFREMHNDLIKLILIKEGMEYQDDNSAFDEMKTAVNSVFPPSALSTFVMSNQKTKMAFVNEVSSIAAGIRLHAWYSHKAGKFMFDVGKIMKDTLPRISEDMHEECDNVKEKVEYLKNELKAKTAENIDNDDKAVFHQKLLLIALTNYYEFVKVLMENIDEVAVQTYKLDYTFAMQIKELNTSLKTGPFTKADNVYPLYKDLAKTWKHMQLEGHLLNFYTNLYQDLKKFAERINNLELDDIEEAEELDEKDPGQERPQESENNAILILPDDAKNYDDITLEYREFCAFYCSVGILLPCDKQLGIVLYNNQCYGFSSEESRDAFKIEPSKYMAATKNYASKVPQIIFTLHMEEYFHFPIIGTPKTKEVLPVFIAESSVQTVLHPKEKDIDYTYNWNQWSLRKQALKYVDLLGKKTHSTQTSLSHFRRENYSQVYLPKDNSTQTKRDASTSISRVGMPELYTRTRKTFIT